MSVTAAKGFRASGVTAGLKPSGRPDVALVVNDGPAHVAAAVYTSNRCRAHPVLWSEQVTGDGVARAVLLNSGGANCYTGPEGFQTTHASAERTAAGLPDCGAGDVVICSTGLIGEQLDRDRLFTGIDLALAELKADGGADAAAAIMTTDTRDKQVVLSVGGDAEGATWTLGGMAKGAGMLAPGLATMLVVLTTDAEVDAAGCQAALRAASRVTFDRLDSDGCMSTNDTVLLMASGASGVRPDPRVFADTVRQACHDLAMQLLSDAEGSEHEIAIEVRGAATEDEAVQVARAVSRSNLFKCAIYGKDANWGRILAAVGTTSAAFEPHAIDVAMNGVWICRGGEPGEPRDLVDLTAREVTVTIDLHAGPAAATVWTNDLTHAYVHENSAYST